MRKIALLLVVLFAAVPLPAQKLVTIFHTSDIHGLLYPRHGQGGYAALAAVLKRESGPFLLLDSGDFFQLGPSFSSQSIKTIDMMNAVHYHAATLGNHESNLLNPQLPRLLQEARFSVLASNFPEQAVLPPFIKPYEVFNVNEVRVAVIGLANISPRMNNNSGGLVALSKTLESVQKEQADVVVVLAHESLQQGEHLSDMDLGQISEQFAGQVHVVLGGHAHILLENERRNGVLFVESGSHLQHVSKVTVAIDNNTGKVIRADSELIPLIVGQTGEDQAIKAIGEQLREPGIDTFLGTAAAKFELLPSSDEQLDSSVNNWLADLMREYTGAQIAVQHNFGARLELLEGDITERDLLETYPFDDTVTQFLISGQLLQEFAERTLGLCCFSGLDITYTEDENGARRIISMEVDGSPLEPDKMYTLATNSYLAFGGRGGEGEFVGKPGIVEQKVEEKLLRTLMKEKLMTQGLIVPTPTGRIQKIELPVHE